jgi:hypothetical protein
MGLEFGESHAARDMNSGQSEERIPGTQATAKIDKGTGKTGSFGHF